MVGRGVAEATGIGIAVLVGRDVAETVEKDVSGLVAIGMGVCLVGGDAVTCAGRVTTMVVTAVSVTVQAPRKIIQESKSNIRVIQT
jgi:hypothetical protein